MNAQLAEVLNGTPQAELVALADYQPAALSCAKQGQSGQSQGWPLTHAQFGQHNCPQHTASWAIALTSQ